MEQNRWQLQHAKNRLSELIERARQAPQIITQHGRETAVVLSLEQYEALKQPRRSFVAHLLGIPKGVPGDPEPDWERHDDPPRDVDL